MTYKDLKHSIDDVKPSVELKDKVKEAVCSENSPRCFFKKKIWIATVAAFLTICFTLFICYFVIVFR